MTLGQVARLFDSDLSTVVLMVKTLLLLDESWPMMTELRLRRSVDEGQLAVSCEEGIGEW